MRLPASRHIQRSQPLGQQVYDQLRADLVNLRHRPGDRLVEANLAREMNVSRTPVREALRRLQADGLLRENRISGYTVIAPSAADIREIFAVREVIEPPSFAEVVATAEAATLEQLESALRAIIIARDRAESEHATRQFRHLWIDCLTNSRMRETILRFDAQANLVRAATLADAAARNAASQGARELLDAVLARDAEAARTAQSRFIITARSFFETTSPPLGDTR